MDPGDEAQQVLGSFMKTMGMILSAVLVCVLFAFLGSMTYPGLGAVAGGLIGFFLGLVIGFFACGKYKEVVDAIDDVVDTQHFVPEFMHEGTFGHQRFTLYVTIHEMMPPPKRNWMGLSGTDNFIRIVCGRNPPKTTCVRENGVWNETFKLTVEAQDTSVTFEVIDQNTLIDTKVASVAVPLAKIFESLGKGPIEPKLQSKAKSMGVLRISFKAGEDISTKHVPNKDDRRLCVQDTTYGEGTQAKWYGTFASKNAASATNSAYFNTNEATRVSLQSRPGTADSVRPLRSSDHLLGSAGSGRGAQTRQPTQRGLQP